MAELNVKVKCTDLENVTNMIKIIDSKIKEEGFCSEYNYSLLKALLGDKWEYKYNIGDGIVMRGDK